ncbi:arylamine N-acetyltransferase [Luteimonas sp. BDR2-5]|uniref:arylamine N-acetyltransferase family protein n=1 Tax=Proluteimonas luteida TaxID=2878685 RepID=UPI001E45DC93|nr:arylamine N-acetyltransferase [Luteimonas sp. BDR2-5]MCD9028812.1 arylamine N-acetyltransferase [Luteimonas sp. BDR2-5]
MTADPMHDLYLQRLGFARLPPPTLETLRALQLRHTQAFPFETLAMLLREPVPLDLPSLERKLLRDGRGGYCYELNQLFLALLLRLGFDARGITGRVVMGGPEDARTARSHMALLVHVDDVPWLVDVGFGGMVPSAPLRLDTGSVQATPHEPYRITDHGDSRMLRAQVAGQWRALYRFDLQPQSTIDYEVGNWYVSTHPDSPFRDRLIAARTGPGLRRTLRDGHYTVHRIGAPRRQRTLDSVASVIDVLQQDFGIRVPAHPQLHDAIARRIRTEAVAS